MSHREMAAAALSVGTTSRQRLLERSSDPTWFTCPANLSLLARYVVDVLDFDRYDLVRLIEEPWEWNSEFKAAIVWQADSANGTRVAQ